MLQNIGPFQLNSPLIQAPLAGISCAAMRRLPWKYGGLSYTCSEMLSAHQLAHETDRSPRYYSIAKDEGPVCFQLSGHDPYIMAKATQKAQEYGASLIDLNVGCPKPKIRSKRCGSALLANSKLLQQLLTAMRKEASCALTVKIRVDNNSDDDYNSSVLDAIHAANVDAIIVHGRNWRDDYNTPVSKKDIKYFTQNSDLPVIANGDISNAKQYNDLISATGASAVMIGRAAIGQPWLYASIIAEINGQTQPNITQKTQELLFIEHVTQLAQLENNEYLACIQARRLAKHYLKKSTNIAHQLPLIYECTTISQLLNCL